jgi:hypothetical protein
LTYRLNQELARDPNEPKPKLALGSIFHKAVEEFWTHQTPLAQTVSKLEQDVIFATTGGLSEDWAKTFKMLDAMAGHYTRWVETGETMSEKVLAVELPMEVRFGTFNGYEVILTGKVDRWTVDTFTDQNLLIDLKTCVAFQSGMTHHFQLLTYALMMRMAHKVKIDRLITEQCKKVLGTSTAKPPFVQRIEMFVNDEMLNRHKLHLEKIIGDMTVLIAEYDAEQALYTGEDENPSLYNPNFYPNPTSDCSWECEFIPVCCQMDDGSDFGYTLERSYRIRPTEDSIL